MDKMSGSQGPVMHRLSHLTHVTHLHSNIPECIWKYFLIKMITAMRNPNPLKEHLRMSIDHMNLANFMQVNYTSQPCYQIQWLVNINPQLYLKICILLLETKNHWDSPFQILTVKNATLYEIDIRHYYFIPHIIKTSYTCHT